MSYKDDLVKKITDAQEIVSDIGSSKAWQKLIDDFKNQQKILDNNWQDITNEEKLNQARVLKMAVKFVLDLPQKYNEQISALQKELNRVNNPLKRTGKYYDTETILENPLEKRNASNK